MATKVNGPVLADYLRALKAARRMGVKAVRIEIGKGAIVMLMDDTYLENLALGQSPAQSSEEEVKEVKTLW